MNSSEKLLNLLKNALPPGNHSLAEPYLKGKEKEYLNNCIDTNYVSSVGAYVNRFEEELQEFTSIKKAVVTSNGTSALHLSLILAGVKNNDEVLLPTLTFIATANAISYVPATPHFVDSSEKHLGIDVDKLANYLHEIIEKKETESINRKTGRKISALIAMHSFGHISPDTQRLKKLCDDYHICFIEDAAEALGSYYESQHAGSWGILSALSFNGNKIVTTGGGGAVLTNDLELGQRAKHLSTTAKLAHPWRFFHDQIGYNYRMPNINAALGCAQLEQLNVFLKAKKSINQRYLELFKSEDEFRVFMPPSGCDSNFWLPILMLQNSHTEKLNDTIELLTQNGIGVRPVWELMTNLPMYKNCPQMNLDKAQFLAQSIVCLPSSVALAEEFQ